MRLQINTHDIEIHFWQADVVDCWWEYCNVWLRQACPFLGRVLGYYLMIIGLSLSCTRLLVNHLKVKMWRPIYRTTMIGVRVLCVRSSHEHFFFFDYSRQRGTEPPYDCTLDNRLIIEKKRDIRTSLIFIFLSTFFTVFILFWGFTEKTWWRRIDERLWWSAISWLTPEIWRTKMRKKTL